MNNPLVLEIAHKQIILDLTVRTLERDRKHMGDLKMLRAFEMWYEVKIRQVQVELKNTKSELGKLGAKVQSSKLDGDYTEYIIIERGKEFSHRYSNIALRNWTEEEVKRLLGLDYKKPSDRM